jgi:hypothetical protein
MAGFMQRMRLVTHLLWIDCIAAALAGTLVMSLGDRLADLYAMPPAWLRLIGAVNLLYACLSGTLALRDKRSVRWVAVLSIANGAWSMACIGIAAAMAGTATAFCMAHLLGEAAFVGSLAVLEWRWRHRLGIPGQAIGRS